MACDDLITTQQLTDASLDAVTLGEVATSRAGAVAGGAQIDTVTNRFGDVTDSVLGRLKKLGYIFTDPIPDWSAGALITEQTRVYRYPATTGDLYVPKKQVPFTTDPTFNAGNWQIVQGATVDQVEDIADERIAAQTDLWFDTVAAMQSANLQPGEVAVTKGYYSAGDGGGATYLIEASGSPDGFGDHALINGNVAILQVGASRDIRLWGVNSSQSSSVNSGALQAAYDKAVSDGVYELYSRGQYVFLNKLTVSQQGFNLDLGPTWDNGWILDAASPDDAMVEIAARLCQINGGRIIADGKIGVYISAGQLLHLQRVNIRGCETGVYHEVGNSVTGYGIFIESCTNGYVMEPVGEGDTNGCTLQGRSFNCEIGFDMRVNKAPSGSSNDPIHNEIFWSTEGNTIGFKQRGGRYNHLHIYSESNNRSGVNPNANWDTDGSANVWYTRNPDNETVIKSPKAAGWDTRGDSVYHEPAKVRNTYVFQDFPVSGTLNYNGRVYQVANSSGATRNMELSLISQMGVGDTITIFKTDNTAGLTYSWSGGTLVGSIGTFGAFVQANEVKELRITRIDLSTALIQRTKTNT